MTALAVRTACASSPVRFSTALATSAHLRCLAGVAAARVWRCASFAFHGIATTSLNSFYITEHMS